MNTERNRVNTLIYHRVADLENDYYSLAVSPDNFYAQMRYLKDNYNIIRFEEDWRGLTEPAVVVTFDDGYQDNYTQALPILQELEIPVTIFVSTGNIGTKNEYWWDEIERLLMYNANKDSFTLEHSIYNCTWYTRNCEERKALIEVMHWLIYGKASLEERIEWLGQLRNWAGCEKEGRTSHYSLSIKELKKLAGNPLVTLGAHTINHASLATQSVEQQKQEISESIKFLEEYTDQNIAVFSYPFGGKKDYTTETINILKTNNIIKAAANFPGVWNPLVDNYQIPRNLVRDWNKDKFAYEIASQWKIDL